MWLGRPEAFGLFWAIFVKPVHVVLTGDFSLTEVVSFNRIASTREQ